MNRVPTLGLRVELPDGAGGRLRGVGRADRAAEQVGDVMPRHVHDRHHDVGWPIVRQLDDVLAEIGLDVQLDLVNTTAYFERWDAGALEWAQAAGFSVPMHTAMRLAMRHISGSRVLR